MWPAHLCQSQTHGWSPRRLTEPARANKRTGMHALAIEVDLAAYRAVKVEAFRRQTAIPTLLGVIVRDALRSSNRSSPPTGSRWRRTGEGRRANQHTRIDLDDETWQAVHIEALEPGHT